MKAFICRWSNGGVSVVTARSKKAARLYLDYVIDDVPIASIDECPARVILTLRKRCTSIDNTWSDAQPLRDEATS